MISRRESAPFLICDSYVLQGCKSKFIYMAHNFEVTGFALSRRFMVNNVLDKYPSIIEIIQKESLSFYKKNIFDPVNEDRLAQIQIMNKKSVYKDI